MKIERRFVVGRDCGAGLQAVHGGVAVATHKGEQERAQRGRQ